MQRNAVVQQDEPLELYQEVLMSVNNSGRFRSPSLGSCASFPEEFYHSPALLAFHTYSFSHGAGQKHTPIYSDGEFAVAHDDAVIDGDGACGGNDIDVNLRVPVRAGKFWIGVAERNVQAGHLLVL